MREAKLRIKIFFDLGSATGPGQRGKCPAPLPRSAPFTGRGGAGQWPSLPRFWTKVPRSCFLDVFTEYLAFFYAKNGSRTKLLLFFVKFFQKIREFYKPKLFCSRVLEIYFHRYPLKWPKMILRSTRIKFFWLLVWNINLIDTRNW